MDMEFELPRLSLELFSSKSPEVAHPDIILQLVIESVGMHMYSEVKPVYSKMNIFLKNLYIRDFKSPNKAMPFFIQTIITGNHQYDSENRFLKTEKPHFRDVNAMEITMETNPRNTVEFVG